MLRTGIMTSERLAKECPEFCANYRRVRPRAIA
jgi:hypothetical protein